VSHGFRRLRLGRSSVVGCGWCGERSTKRRTTTQYLPPRGPRACETLPVWWCAPDSAPVPDGADVMAGLHGRARLTRRGHRWSSRTRTGCGNPRQLEASVLNFITGVPVLALECAEGRCAAGETAEPGAQGRDAREHARGAVPRTPDRGQGRARHDRCGSIRCCSFSSAPTSPSSAWPLQPTAEHRHTASGTGP